MGAVAGAGASHAKPPANKGSVVKKLLDVPVALNGAVVALESLLVLLLQEPHAAQREVRQCLPPVARDSCAKELRGFGKVAVGGSEGSQSEHIAEALRDRRAQVERGGEVLEREDGLAGMQRPVALPVEEGAATRCDIELLDRHEAHNDKTCHYTPAHPTLHLHSDVPVAQAQLHFAVLAGLSLRQIAIAHEQVGWRPLDGRLQSIDFQRAVCLQLVQLLLQPCNHGAAVGAAGAV